MKMKKYVAVDASGTAINNLFGDVIEALGEYTAEVGVFFYTISDLRCYYKLRKNDLVDEYGSFRLVAPEDKEWLENIKGLIDFLVAEGVDVIMF